MHIWIGANIINSTGIASVIFWRTGFLPLKVVQSLLMILIWNL